MVTSSILREKSGLLSGTALTKETHVFTTEAHMFMLEELMPFLQNREGKHMMLGMGTYFGLFYTYSIHVYCPHTLPFIWYYFITINTINEINSIYTVIVLPQNPHHSMPSAVKSWIKTGLLSQHHGRYVVS